MHIKNEKIDIKSFEQGYLLLAEEILKNSKVGYYSSDPNIKPIPIEDFQFSEELEIIKDEIESEFFSKTDSIHGNFSSDVQFLFYEIATSFYHNCYLDKAITTFLFLTTINPYVPAFWIGLGLAYEKNLDQYKAINCFKTAIKVSDPDDFTPYIGLIRCYENIQDFVELEEFLEAAKENEAIKEQAIAALDYLKTKK